MFQSLKNLIKPNKFCKNGIAKLKIKGRKTLGMYLLGFGQDRLGELYVLGNTTGNSFGMTGSVWKIEKT